MPLLRLIYWSSTDVNLPVSAQQKLKLEMPHGLEQAVNERAEGGSAKSQGRKVSEVLGRGGKDTQQTGREGLTHTQRYR